MASYIEGALIKDEKVIYTGHISLWSLAPLIALGVLLLFAGGLGIIFWVVAYIRYKTTELAFTPEIIEALNYERFHHPVPLVQRRMEVLWLKSHGLPHAQIAMLGNLSETTLREYFQWYQDGGVEGLKQVHFYRPESELVQHANSLEDYFRLNPPASIKAAQSEIETLTGIKRSETQVREFLKKNAICVVAKSG